AGEHPSSWTSTRRRAVSHGPRVRDHHRPPTGWSVWRAVSPLATTGHHFAPLAAIVASIPGPSSPISRAPSPSASGGPAPCSVRDPPRPTAAGGRPPGAHAAVGTHPGVSASQDEPCPPAGRGARAHAVADASPSYRRAIECTTPPRVRSPPAG